MTYTLCSTFYFVSCFLFFKQNACFLHWINSERKATFKSSPQQGWNMTTVKIKKKNLFYLIAEHE